MGLLPQDRVEVRLADGATPLAAAGSVDRVIATAAVRMRVGFMGAARQRTPGAAWSALRWDDPTAPPALTEVDPFMALLRGTIAISVPLSDHRVLGYRTVIGRLVAVGTFSALAGRWPIGGSRQTSTSLPA
jgi:hypothetical protein